MKFDDKLSEHFTYGEFTKSPTADELRMSNQIPDELIPNIKALLQNVLEPLRSHYNRPVIITSGYRCPALNAIISNKTNSQHLTGEAADIRVKGISNLEAAMYIRDNLKFDQLILEMYNDSNPFSGWVHCSYSLVKNRKDVLRTMNRIKYESGLV